MHIAVTTDGATVVHKEVADEAEAQTYVDRGFHVKLMVDGEWKPFPAEDAAPQAEAAPAAKTRSAPTKKSKAK